MNSSSQSQPSADVSAHARTDAQPSAAFTPGPWRAGGSLAVWQEAGGVVAQCYWVSGAIGVDVAEANARLISAAPEMYAALLLTEEANEARGRGDASRAMALHSEALAARRAALAKAEGK